MARELGKMSRAEIDKLTPAQLMRFNNPLPEIDYDNPYDPEENPYPKVLYGPNAAGTDLITATVESEEQEMELDGDWRDSPADWGIITHPEAPRFSTGGAGFSAPLPDKIIKEIAAKRAEEKKQAIATAAAEKKGASKD